MKTVKIYKGKMLISECMQLDDSIVNDSTTGVEIDGEDYRKLLKLEKYFSIGEYFIIKEYEDGVLRIVNTDGSELTEEQYKKLKNK